MSYLLKIYENQNSSTVLTQILDIISIQINFDISDISNATIKVPLYYNWLKQFNKIEIYETITNNDLLIFQWYIFNLKISTKDIEIISKDEKSLLKKKLVISDKTYSWQTITTIVNDLLSDWNILSWDNLTFTSSINTTVSKDFSEWDNLFDCIEELSWLVWWVFTSNNWQIIVETILWEDKTTWSNFTELVYNWKDPNENNIYDVVIENYETVSNIIIWKNSSGKINQKDTISIWLFWALWLFQNFRDWDLSNQTISLLDSVKNEQKMFSFAIENSSINPNIWDKIKLRIENVNDYLNINTDVIVNTKEIKIDKWSKIIIIWVSTIYVYVDSFIKRLRSIDKKINLLSL